MSQIDEIATDYVRQLGVLDPVQGTRLGLSGNEADLTDYSPEGNEARAELKRTALRKLSGARAESKREQLAAETMTQRLSTALELHDSGEWLYGLRALGSPLQSIQQTFDLMATGDDQEWEQVAQRLQRVPQALGSFRLTLEEGMRRGKVAARRQVQACAAKAQVWSGRDGTGYFRRLIHGYQGGSEALRRQLSEAATQAELAYGQMERYLLEDYLPSAPERDAAGRERYLLSAHDLNGMAIDPEELYQWGWEELGRIRREMEETAERILPGGGLDRVIELLSTDPARVIEGPQDFLRWNQELLDRSVEELNGTHFDIPAPVQRVEAHLAPEGSGAAMYYTRPSEDFSRPGRTWYPVMGRTSFPLWGEVSTCYHEGVPGHHLQLAQICYRKDRLNLFQRTAAGTPGLTEGWALYAERLMGELGYLENPDYYLGMLSAHAMRAARVVVDIGLHLELDIPEGQAYHPGERWSAELAVDFMVANARRGRDFFTSEVDRYLGWPGQAIAYKLGERVWLETRELTRRSWGDAFTLKDFHRAALDLGMVSLEQLRRELPASPPGG